MHFQQMTFGEMGCAKNSTLVATSGFKMTNQIL